MQKSSQGGLEASVAISDASPIIALKHAELLEKLSLLFV